MVLQQVKASVGVLWLIMLNMFKKQLTDGWVMLDVSLLLQPPEPGIVCLSASLSKLPVI